MCHNIEIIGFNFSNSRSLKLMTIKPGRGSLEYLVHCFIKIKCDTACKIINESLHFTIVNL